MRKRVYRGNLKKKELLNLLDFTIKRGKNEEDIFLIVYALCMKFPKNKWREAVQDIMCCACEYVFENSRSGLEEANEIIRCMADGRLSEIKERFNRLSDDSIAKNTYLPLECFSQNHISKFATECLVNFF